MRSTVGLTILSGFVYCCWVAYMWLWSIPQGLLPRPWGYGFTACIVAALCTFYPLVRSGVSRRWSDPSLLVPQILFPSALSIVGYAVAPVAGSLNLQTLALVFMFGFPFMRPRATTFTGCAMVAMLLALLAAIWLLPLPTFDPKVETLKIGCSCLILGLLTAQSRYFGRIRELAFQEKVQLKDAVQQLRNLTRHDALTQLVNRQHMQELLEAERERAVRLGADANFCVALIDLDHFKHVNDHHGHNTGDDVLVSFARIAQKVLRQTDIVGRWGGEEFVVLMPETIPEEAGIVGLERLQAVLLATPMSDRVPELRVSFSAGVAAWQSDETIDRLMDRADRALYAAKAAGRRRIVLAGAGSEGPTDGASQAA